MRQVYQCLWFCFINAFFMVLAGATLLDARRKLQAAGNEAELAAKWLSQCEQLATDCRAAYLSARDDREKFVRRFELVEHAISVIEKQQRETK